MEQQTPASPFATGTAPAVQGTQPNGAAGGTSMGLDFTGAETVDLPPPNGEYDFTVLRFNHCRTKKEGSAATYVDAQIQLDTEPAKGRQVFDMLLTSYADGTVVGTPAAAAQNRTRGNTALAVILAIGLPASILNVPGPILDVIGKRLRGRFRAEDDNGEKKLRLKKVTGAPTGVGFIVKVAPARPAGV